MNSTATVGAQNRSSHRALRTRSNRSMKTRFNRFCLVIENQALFQQPSLLCHLEYRMLQVDQAQERSVRKGQSIGSMSTSRVSRWKRSISSRGIKPRSSPMSPRRPSLGCGQKLRSKTRTIYSTVHKGLRAVRACSLC